MAIYKNISSKVIIRKIFRDLNPNTDNWIDDAVEWVGEALEHIGASPQLVTKTCIVDIKDYKGAMPPDLYYINQVAINTTADAESMGYNIGVIRDELNNILEGGANSSAQLNEVNARLHVLETAYMDSSSLTLLAYCTTNFPKSVHCENCVNEYSTGEDCYYVDDNMIKTSFPRGKVCLSYTAFPIDDDCYPMVPDDISFKEAMFWYVYKKMLLGGMPPTNNGIDYGFAEQQWKYYCTQARNTANYPDIDKYESFLDQWVRLIPNINRHAEGFSALGARESLDRSGKYGVRSQLGSSPRLTRASAISKESSAPARPKKESVVYWFDNTQIVSAASTIPVELTNPLVGEFTLNENDYSVTRNATSWSVSDLTPNLLVRYNFVITLTTLGASEITVQVMMGDTLMEDFLFTSTTFGEQEYSGAAEASAGSFESGELKVLISSNTAAIGITLKEGNIKIS